MQRSEAQTAMTKGIWRSRGWLVIGKEGISEFERRRACYVQTPTQADSDGVTRR